MYLPLHYQVSEYDCVPTALINAMSYLFLPKGDPPMVIRHIYLYCLDTVGKNMRFGTGGTSKYAVRLVGNWLNSYKMNKFSVHTNFLEQEDVCLEKGGKIHDCLAQGGVVLCNIFLNTRDEHYIMITDIKDDWVYCFDSYRRISIHGLNGNVKVLKSDDGRAPNLKIKLGWLVQTEAKRFCMGPVHNRESLMIRRNS